MRPTDEWEFEFTAGSGPNRMTTDRVLQSDDPAVKEDDSVALRYLLIRESELDKVSGGSYQCTLTINCQPDGQTVVPLRAEFVNTVKEDSNGNEYIEDTSVSQRDA